MDSVSEKVSKDGVIVTDSRDFLGGKMRGTDISTPILQILPESLVTEKTEVSAIFAHFTS